MTRMRAVSAASDVIHASQPDKRKPSLLLNILPRMVATELKMTGVALAKRYEHTTVFFSDFVNFTSIAERMSPEDLVKLLDDYFKTFDSIITRHNLEKIKTIGDAYMCVGGLPEESSDHAIRVVKAALEIQQILAEKRKAYESAGSRFFDARIGVHTGPVVSGVVGSTKFAFDIWGDTVNVAARMEHSGEPGRVNVSADTYELIKHRFACTSRGLIPVKNRGDMGMYFVESEIISI
jgi:adenylate cyclase